MQVARRGHFGVNSDKKHGVENATQAKAKNDNTVTMKLWQGKKYQHNHWTEF